MDIRKILGNYIADAVSCYNIKLNNSDLDYVNNIMWQDSVARILLHGGMNTSGLENNPNYSNKNFGRPQLLNHWLKLICICEKYYYDLRCPSGTKQALFAIMGLFRDWIQSKTGSLAILDMRRRYIERWFEMCK